MSETQKTRGSRTVGLFDLRWIIATLMGAFGVVVTVMGIFDSSSSVAASGRSVGVNVNLWTGIPMVLLAAGFALWAGLRPIRIPTVVEEAGQSGQTEQSGDGHDEA